MWINNVNLCDFCFTPLDSANKCPKCGLSVGSYHVDADLLPPGTNLIGKYIIGRTLGRGGFGATYLSYSSDKRHPVAIKEYFPNQIACRAKGETKVSIVSNDKHSIFQRGAKRFFEEAKSMSKFRGSDSIVDVYEFFYCNDTAYYSMEYLEGIDLKGYIEKRGGKISEPEAVKIMKAVGDALMVIHSTGMLHRDISPDNIFVCKNGKVKLIDFGSAKQVVGEQSQSLSVILKQGFAPYEQYQKGGNQGMWTDIYALGATMYYAVTGVIPDDAMSRIQNPTIEINPNLGISEKFVNIIDKCMKMNISERFQSAHELVVKLNEIAEPDVQLGQFEQSVYVNRNIKNLEGGSPMNWENNDQNNGNPQQWQGQPQEGTYQNNSQYQQPYQPQYPPQYPQSYQPPYQQPYTPPYQPSAKKDKSDIVKKIIIIVGIAFIVAMLVTVFIELMKPAAAAELTQCAKSAAEALHDPSAWINGSISCI